MASGGIGLLGWARWAWRVLKSMQVALALLALLALTAVSRINSAPARRREWTRQRWSVSFRTIRASCRDCTGSGQVLRGLLPTWFAASYLLLVSTTGCVLCLAIRNIQERPKEADTPKASTAKPTRCSSKEALAP